MKEILEEVYRVIALFLGVLYGNLESSGPHSPLAVALKQPQMTDIIWAIIIH